MKRLIYFKVGENIKALNNKGEVSKVYEKGAVITSITKGYGSNVGTLWMITGNDENSIKNAVKLLYGEPEKIKGKFSVIVAGSEILNIPTKN